MSENIPRIYHLSDKIFKLLPEWAYFFIRLGYQIAEIPNENYRVVIGLALPTRFFACSLATTGVVLARAGKENSISNQHINELTPGTLVYIRTDNNRKHPGVVKGFKDYYGKQLIIIQIGKSETKGFPLDHYASRITIADREEVRLPRYKKKGYLAEKPSNFLQSCLGKDLAQRHILNSTFEALIVGNKSVIKPEITSNKFSCKNTDATSDMLGCLQDILRIRQFLGTQKPYRCQCISSLNITPTKEIGEKAPPIVVFDGAIAYIKLGHKWKSAHQIVLLDRTERQFEDSIELLNQNYTYRLTGRYKFPIKIPNGIEMMLFRNGIQ